jgi:hypothetical protein
VPHAEEHWHEFVLRPVLALRLPPPVLALRLLHLPPVMAPPRHLQERERRIRRRETRRMQGSWQV